MSERTVITGKGLPLVGNDIDTDRIIPARFLRCVTFDGLGEQVFADDRKALNGQHPFDLPQYQNAKILVVNGNFGCGSSREHAPQAIARWGIDAIIGESFAEIFFGNCLAMGIPCVTSSAENIKSIQNLLQENPDIQMTLDLESLKVKCGHYSSAIKIDSGARNMLVTGKWDTCSLLIKNISQIKNTAEKLPYLAW
ncbi:3-isopropylmalate dehydratase small subunit [Cyanobacterium aponinum UTEX 3222]|uniref:3-isopropylmalate dehydratase small subunit n=3 Tax=Cyanobacterium aponinum TaxID=379064 RepID=K9Z7I2_CYAAP|nr:3-isopropylmalate dehydratase small subunit [Cyanobacterium aponinum]RMD72917.1 MAG: 3-isopropylmalate dehydratase small subunit [Cyanobacteria bacterium J149]WRL43707.1 3-isopropylmalate dehydratase small subunit [Cyanobacterium aponinum UTEX 3222]AFZ54348.1 3-isopropylmalate dehydratase, small subunit [Cyanobacterium aponinum PCC 10605]MBD2394752.1 3-isopropylmalate dehydratase small subunit [Cyanobacterium aponinum FACHB-4101]MTF38722.1 3-isopropylmalate dehydratase small subunit [Cyanob